MIDIHAHTRYSDGSDSVQEILTIAQEAKLTHLSITDHNTIDAYNDEAIKNKSKWFDGNIIPGVEITTTYKGEIVEILGYGFDLELMGNELKKNVLTFEEKQQKEYELIKNAYTKIGIQFNEDAIEFNPKTSSSRKSFWKEIIKYPKNVQRLSNPTSIDSSSKFTRQEVYNPKSDFYVDETSLYPTFQETIDMIHRCGGIAFLAHLYIYSHARDIRKELLKIVEEHHLDGIECYYSTFSKSEMEDLEEFCNRYKLLKSGGSDYHGTRKIGIQLGIGKGSLNVSEEILMDWAKYILSAKL